MYYVTIEFLGETKQRSTLRVCLGESRQQALPLAEQWLQYCTDNSTAPIVKYSLSDEYEYLVPKSGDVQKKMTLLFKTTETKKRFRVSLPAPKAGLSALPPIACNQRGELGSAIGMTESYGKT